MRWSIVAAWMLPAVALAQSMTITVDQTSKVVTNNCEQTFTVNWSMTTPGTVCLGPNLWITSASSCSGEAPSGSVIGLSGPGPQDRTGTITTPRLRDFPVFRQGTDGGISCPSATKQDFLVCGAFKYQNIGLGGCDIPVHAASPPAIQYRGVPPTPPTLDSLTPQDGALVANVSVDADTTLIHLYARRAGTNDEFVERKSFTPNVGSGKIDGLENGVVYEVYAVAEDQATNRSVPSNILQAAPVASNGFFRTYRADGGAESGGCGPGAAGAIFFPLLFGVFILLKRRHP
jgi:hypothetical protein